MQYIFYQDILFLGFLTEISIPYINKVNNIGHAVYEFLPHTGRQQQRCSSHDISNRQKLSVCHSITPQGEGIGSHKRRRAAPQQQRFPQGSMPGDAGYL